MAAMSEELTSAPIRTSLVWDRDRWETTTAGTQQGRTAVPDRPAAPASWPMDGER
jgi:hypothetical protein